MTASGFMPMAEGDLGLNATEAVSSLFRCACLGDDDTVTEL